MGYDSDHPKERIARGNPYYCCRYCKVSDPQINGRLVNHLSTCEYRRIKELETSYEQPNITGRS
jgi:hypothetical protein